MSYRRFLVTAAMAMLAAGPTIVSADTPTPAHFAACNAEAKRGAEPGVATPTTKDHMNAEAARNASPARAPYSSDPQLAGMDPAGTTDAGYQAAYRTCMRRSGF
jgi:hypothetical protein